MCVSSCRYLYRWAMYYWLFMLWWVIHCCWCCCCGCYSRFLNNHIVQIITHFRSRSDIFACTIDGTCQSGLCSAGATWYGATYPLHAPRVLGLTIIVLLSPLHFSVQQSDCDFSSSYICGPTSGTCSFGDGTTCTTATQCDDGICCGKTHLRPSFPFFFFALATIPLIWCHIHI
jgi:hypothetical protein